MGVFGPYTAVAGVVQQCPVDPDAQAVYIRNSSIYDLYVAASPIAPAPSTSFGGWPWVARIPQGDRAGIVLPLERYAGAGFPGYIWILPVVSTAAFALTGVLATNNQFTVEGFTDAALLPPGYASSQFHNLSSQHRLISLAPGIQPSTGSNSYPSVSGTQTLVVYTPLPFTPGPSKFLAVYVYAIAIAHNPAPTAAGGIDYTIQVVVRSTVPSTLHTYPIFRHQDYWGGAATTPMVAPPPFTPAVPMLAVCDCTAVNTDHVEIQFLSNAATGTNNGFTWTVLASNDGFNFDGSFPGTIGYYNPSSAARF